jgi:hypothetical protein
MFAIFKSPLVFLLRFQTHPSLQIAFVAIPRPPQPSTSKTSKIKFANMRTFSQFDCVFILRHVCPQAWLLSYQKKPLLSSMLLMAKWMHPLF